MTESPILNKIQIGDIPVNDQIHLNSNGPHERKTTQPISQKAQEILRLLPTDARLAIQALMTTYSLEKALNTYFTSLAVDANRQTNFSADTVWKHRDYETFQEFIARTPVQPSKDDQIIDYELEYQKHKRLRVEEQDFIDDAKEYHAFMLKGLGVTQEQFEKEYAKSRAKNQKSLVNQQPMPQIDSAAVVYTNSKANQSQAAAHSPSASFPDAFGTNYSTKTARSTRLQTKDENVVADVIEVAQRHNMNVFTKEDANSTLHVTVYTPLEIKENPSFPNFFRDLDTIQVYRQLFDEAEARQTQPAIATEPIPATLPVSKLAENPVQKVAQPVWKAHFEEVKRRIFPPMQKIGQLVYQSIR